MGQQGVFLTLDVVSILAGEPVIFGLTNLVERCGARQNQSGFNRLK
jgi:hypothetical protein